MKQLKQMVSVMLTLVLVIALAAPSMLATAAPTTAGSITVNGSEDGKVSVAGKTFKAYQILKAEIIGDAVQEDGSGIIYRVPEGMEDFYAEYFGLQATKGKASFDQDVTDAISALGGNDAEALEQFAKAALEAAKSASVTSFTEVGAKGADSVTFSNLPLGYYVVEDEGAASPISALILTTTAPNADVNVKATQPEITKKIDGGGDTDENSKGLVDHNQVAIGDKVPYVLNTKVPDMRGYEKYFFIVKDELSKGLTFNNDVAIKMTLTVEDEDAEEDGATKTEEKTLTAGKDFYVVMYSDNNYEEETDDATKARSFKIVFMNFIQYKGQTNAPIEITYSATLNKDAEIGVDPNTNTVQLEYSNNPNTKAEGKDEEHPDEPGKNPPTGVTPKDTVYTYVTGLELIKTNGKENLAGAVFTITGDKMNIVVVEEEKFTESETGEYWKLKDGTYTTTDPNGEGINKDVYEDLTTKYVKETVTSEIKTKENVNYEFAVDSNGILKVDGLATGTYTITEIKAPNGYNMLKEPIVITITCNSHELGEADTKCTWTLEGESDIAQVLDNGIIELTVVNKSGLQLPETGGIGTTIFYIVGAVLVVGAVILLVTKRRVGSNQ